MGSDSAQGASPSGDVYASNPSQAGGSVDATASSVVNASSPTQVAQGVNADLYCWHQNRGDGDDEIEIRFSCIIDDRRRLVVKIGRGSLFVKFKNHTTCIEAHSQRPHVECFLQSFRALTLYFVPFLDIQ